MHYLAQILGNEWLVGAALKDDVAWDGTNSSGFSALPGGARDYVNGAFYGQGDCGYWWSSSPSGAYAWYRYLDSGYSNVPRNYFNSRYGFSVRCVRD